MYHTGSWDEATSESSVLTADLVALLLGFWYFLPYSVYLEAGRCRHH